MSDVKHIVSALGRKNIADALGVSVSAVGNAVMDGRFPANWYGVLSGMCADKGVDCPLVLFAMKGIEQGSAA